MIDILENIEYKPIIDNKIVIKSYQHLNDILEHILNIISNKDNIYNNVNSDYLESLFFTKEIEYIILAKRDKDLIVIDRKDLKYDDILLYSLYDIKNIIKRYFIF